MVALYFAFYAEWECGGGVGSEIMQSEIRDAAPQSDQHFDGKRHSHTRLGRKGSRTLVGGLMLDRTS